jgi:hypothetical protein
MCGLPVGLPEVNFLSINDVAGDPFRVHIEGWPRRDQECWVRRVCQCERSSRSSSWWIFFGFTSFRNYRMRSLLYAGKPNWDLLGTINPAAILRTIRPDYIR